MKLKYDILIVVVYAMLTVRLAEGNKFERSFNALENLNFKTPAEEVKALQNNLSVLNK